MSEWISVEDQLPKKGELVLVFLNTKKYVMSEYCSSWNRGCGAMFVSSKTFIGCDDEATYWRPLPTPPEVDDE